MIDLTNSLFIMKRILLASWGGSGSTYLASTLSACYGGIEIIHSHATPPPHAQHLNLPILNPVTGHAEGPFAGVEVLDPQDTLVIILVRDPSKSYLSRCCFEHFCHMWAGSSMYKRILDNSENLDDKQRFLERWVEYERNERDILHLRQYLDEWIYFANQRAYTMLLMKYEYIRPLRSILSSFITQLARSDSSKAELEHALDSFNPAPGRFSETASRIFSNIDWYTTIAPCQIWPHRH